MGVDDGVGLRSRPGSRSTSACAEFISKNVILPTSSRNSRLYACLKTGRREEYVQKHCELQDKKHENTVLSGEREAAACARAAILWSSIIIERKFLLKELSSEALDWDSPLPEDKEESWEAWRKSLQGLKELEIPRPYVDSTLSTALRK